MRFPIWKRRTEDGGGDTPGAAVSAYLDGEGTAAERAQFEAELAARPELAGELEALRAAKALIQSLPEAEPRRSFALTAEMVAEAETADAKAPIPLDPLRTEAKPNRFAPMLLVAGRAAAGVGVLGLVLVGTSALFSASDGGSDDAASGAFTTMSGALERNSSLESAPGAASAGTMTDGESGGGTEPDKSTQNAIPPGAATAAPEETATFGQASGGDPTPAATGAEPDSGTNSTSGTPAATGTLTPPMTGGPDSTSEGTEAPNAPEATVTAEMQYGTTSDATDTAGGGGGLNDETRAADGEPSPELATTALTLDTADDDDGNGPSRRQLLAIVFGMVAAVGGGAWIGARRL